VEGYLWSMKEQCVVRWLEHPPEGLWATTGEWAVAAFSSVRRRRAEYGPYSAHKLGPRRSTEFMGRSD
jgi:hypothetical protein